MNDDDYPVCGLCDQVMASYGDAFVCVTSTCPVQGKAQVFSAAGVEVMPCEMLRDKPWFVDALIAIRVVQQQYADLMADAQDGEIDQDSLAECLQLLSSTMGKIYRESIRTLFKMGRHEQATVSEMDAEGASPEAIQKTINRLRASMN